MFEEFYQKYETEEQEVIALIRKCIGAGYHKSDNSDFWEMTAISHYIGHGVLQHWQGQHQRRSAGVAGYEGGTQQRKGLGAFAARADLPSEGTQIA